MITEVTDANIAVQQGYHPGMEEENDGLHGAQQQVDPNILFQQQQQQLQELQAAKSAADAELKKVKSQLSSLSRKKSEDVKIPNPGTFCGDDRSQSVDAWLAKLGRYLAVHMMSNKEKQVYVAMLLRGTAEVWWQRYHTPYKTVDDLLNGLYERFRPVSEMRMASNQFAVAVQRGSV